MTRRSHQTTLAGTLLLLAVVAGALGCVVCLVGSAAEISAPASEKGGSAPANGTPPAGSPPDGMGANGTAPGGSTGGGSAGSASSNLSGAYTVDGTIITETGKTFTSETDDLSAVYVTDGGDLTLVDPTISTSGDTSSNDASSFYGLNGAVLASNGSVTIIGGTISTTGSGANGAFPSGTRSSISLSNVTITATGGGGHGVMASGGGTLTLSDTDITTSGANSAPIATDRGGGTVTVTGGTVVSSGIDSPGIYSTGVITVDGASITATGAEAAVIEGKNSIALTNTDLVGSKGTRDRGIMVYQSMSGDADVGLGRFAMTGGSFDWTSTTGPAFYVTNTNATITLSGVAITNSAAELLNASAGDWGTTGSNGGAVVFTAENEALAGSITADEISSITAVLRNGATLSGAITNAALSLDTTSTWTVTGDSALTTLADTAGLSGSTIPNIVGNGHTVTYDANLAGNSALGGKTYSLVNGGTLAPATTNSTTTTTSASGSSGGSEGYTGAQTSTVAATSTGTATATTTPAATETLLPGLTAGTTTPETTGTGNAAETPAGAAATRTAAATATGTTQAGFDALPLAAGALVVGSLLVATRRR
jgi:hypothetical protein